MMYFTVVLPNSVVIEIKVDIRSNGQECLDQVCQYLGILEQDYFGLQFKGSKGEKIWLNMRNKIDQQVSGMRSHRFHLKVKYYVQPHLLLQETSRHLFYLQVKQEILSRSLQIKDETKHAKILALIAQEEYGDQISNCMHSLGYQSFLEKMCKPNDLHLLANIASCHAELRGTPPKNAEYRMLQEASSEENYGMEKHEAKNAERKLITVGVAPDGVFIYDNQMELIERIEYPMFQRVVHDGWNCILSVYNEEMDTRKIEVRLRSNKAACALYRCITEMHSFFRCDTVNCEVSSQVYLDLKGLLASIFNENTTLGQNYVFDVQRTWREVYDSTRRKLMKESNQNLNLPEDIHMETSTESHIVPKDHECQDAQVWKSRLEKIQESFLCSVCMDCDISTVLCPCGHMTCCRNCAERLEECPLCRTTIQNVQPVYLPTPLLQKS